MPRFNARVVSYAALAAMLLAAARARASEDLDLSYVSADAVAAVVLHPKAVLSSPALEMLPTEVVVAAGVDYLGIDISKVDVAIGIFGVSELAMGQPGLGAVLHFSEPYDPQAVLAKLGESTVEAKVGEKTYRQPKVPGSFGYYAADEKTLLLGTAGQLKAMIEAKDVDSQLVRLLKQVDTSRSAVAVVNVAAVRPLVMMALGSIQLPAEFREFMELPQLVEWLQVSIDVEEEFRVDVTLAGADAEGGKRIAALAEKARNMAKQFIETQMIGRLGTSDSAVDAAMAKYLRRVTFKMLDAIEIKQEQEQVEIALFQGSPMTAAAGVGMALLLPATQAAREAARRNMSMNNMKQIAIAMHNHHDAFKRFPPPAIRSKDGKPLLSWRVKILPFLEGNELYQQFRLDEPWDSEHNKKLIEKMPDVFANPNVPEAGRTVYLGVAGPGMLFDPQLKDGVSIRQIIDGTSKTGMVVEADPDRAVVWTKPDDWDYDPQNPIAGLGHLRPGGFNVSFADGSVHFLPNVVDPATLRAIFSFAGREVVEIPQ